MTPTFVLDGLISQILQTADSDAQNRLRGRRSPLLRSNVSGSTGACKPYFVAELVVFVWHGGGAVWDCWIRAVFDCGRVFRRLKTGLLAVADCGSVLAQETAQDMGLDQFLEAGETAGGLVAEGGLVSENIAIQCPTANQPLPAAMAWHARNTNAQHPTPNSQQPNLVGWKFLVGYWIFRPLKNLMEPAKSRGRTDLRPRNNVGANVPFHYREKSTAYPAGALPVAEPESAQSNHLLMVCHLRRRAESHLLHVKTRPR
jgi:hypothetical protein